MITAYFFFKKYVKKSSLAYMNCLRINDIFKSKFIKLEYLRNIIIDYPTKYSFDRDSTYNVLYRILSESREYYKTLFSKAISNEELYNEYLSECFNNYKNLGKGCKKKNKLIRNMYFRIEENIVSNIQLKQPETQISLNLKLIYESPKGRNSYTKYQTFNNDMILFGLQRSYKSNHDSFTQEHRNRIERRKMSVKLRLEILERDGFRCKLCGRSVKDGVKLHIDHIIPISKGGETIKSNLRVLCDECNLGKSNRILENDEIVQN